MTPDERNQQLIEAAESVAKQNMQMAHFLVSLMDRIDYVQKQIDTLRTRMDNYDPPTA